MTAIAAIKHKPEEPDPAQTTFRALAGEMALLGAMAGELEVMLSCHRPGAGLSDNLVEKLQSLDRLSQHLAALREFLVVVSEAEPLSKQALAAALDRIRLGDVKSRLARDCGAPAAIASAADSEVDIWD